MAKMTRAKLKNLSPEKLGRMKEEQIRQILTEARKVVKTQAEKFEKYSSTVYSPAYEKIKDYYGESAENVESMTRNQMLSEVFRLQDFVNAKTSTIPGARKVALEQDKRIYGVDKFGRPNYRMSVDEREKYWSLYQEFLNQNPSGERAYTSDKIQEFLGSMAKSNRGEKLDFNAETLDRLKQELDKSRDIMQFEDEEEILYGSVFSGKRNDY